MKPFIIIITLLSLSLSLFAQKFNKAVGARLGVTSGVFYDKGNDDLSTYRYLLSNRKDGFQFTMIKYRQHYKLDQIPDNFSIYYGVGVHAGFVRWSETVTNNEEGYYWRNRTAPVIGVDGLVGISYDLRHMPISITLDTKPFFDLWGKNIFNPVPFDMSLGFVYHF